MAESEQFSWKKFFQGFLSITTNAKNVQFVVWFVIVVCVFSAVFRLFSPKSQAQTQNSRVVALPFSRVDYHYSPSQAQKQEEKKRPWWLPHIFVEGYGFQETGGRVGVGGRAGARFEW